MNALATNIPETVLKTTSGLGKLGNRSFLIFPFYFSTLLCVLAFLEADRVAAAAAVFSCWESSERGAEWSS